jgi:homoserine dehydrogenase
MLKIAIAGLGTVGSGVVRLLHNNAELIAARAGCGVDVKAVSARDKNRKRDCDFSGIAWIDDSRQLASLPDVDAVVELIGGVEGVARELAEASLKNGKHYVTANKALVAAHGAALARLGEKNGAHLLFEASVAGGIPVIKTLREGLAGNRVSILRGILNGTCNYILTRMQEAGLSFEDALLEAQTKGYAEADPSADIDGHDTANKLAILAALAFGAEPDLAAVSVEGIRRIVPLDLKFAAELECRIKLLGVARASEGGVEQHVSPCLVPVSSPLARVDGAMNAILIHGDFVGDVTLEGAGAGAEPTASAVVADLIDLARGRAVRAFGLPAAGLGKLNKAPASVAARHYLRLQVMDKPGVVADIAAILRDEEISIEALLQRGTPVAGSVPVVITTHDANTAAMKRAADKIARLPVVAAPPCVLRIED